MDVPSTSSEMIEMAELTALKAKPDKDDSMSASDFSTEKSDVSNEAKSVGKPKESIFSKLSLPSLTKGSRPKVKYTPRRKNFNAANGSCFPVETKTPIISKTSVSSVSVEKSVDSKSKEKLESMKPSITITRIINEKAVIDEKSSTDKTPAKKLISEKTTAKNSSSEKTPAKNTSSEKTTAKNLDTEKTTAKNLDTVKTASKNMDSEKTPTKDLDLEKTATKSSSSETKNLDSETSKSKQKPTKRKNVTPNPTLSDSNVSAPSSASKQKVTPVKMFVKQENGFSDIKIKPFMFGWRREVVFRATNDLSDKKKRPVADIYYFDPKGKKLRSMPEIISYIRDNKIMELGAENFTFFKEPIYSEPDEIVRHAKTRPNKDGISPPLSTPTSTPSPISTPGSSVKVVKKKTAPITAPSESTPVAIEPVATTSGSGSVIDTPKLREKRGRKIKVLPPDFMCPDEAAMVFRKKTPLTPLKLPEENTGSPSVPIPQSITNKTNVKTTQDTVLTKKPPRKRKATVNKSSTVKSPSVPPTAKKPMLLEVKKEILSGSENELNSSTSSIVIESSPIKDNSIDSGKNRPKVCFTFSKLPAAENNNNNNNVGKNNNNSQGQVIPFKKRRITSSEPIRVSQNDRMCSLSCPGRGCQLPTLHCNICLCLFHPECVGFLHGPPTEEFKCQRCLYQPYLKSTEKPKEDDIPVEEILNTDPEILAEETEMNNIASSDDDENFMTVAPEVVMSNPESLKDPISAVRSPTAVFKVVMPYNRNSNQEISQNNCIPNLNAMFPHSTPVAVSYQTTGKSILQPTVCKSFDNIITENSINTTISSTNLLPSSISSIISQSSSVVSTEVLPTPSNSTISTEPIFSTIPNLITSMPTPSIITMGTSPITISSYPGISMMGQVNSGLPIVTNFGSCGPMIPGIVLGTPQFRLPMPATIPMENQSLPNSLAQKATIPVSLLPNAAPIVVGSQVLTPVSINLSGIAKGTLIYTNNPTLRFLLPSTGGLTSFGVPPTGNTPPKAATTTTNSNTGPLPSSTATESQFIPVKPPIQVVNVKELSLCDMMRKIPIIDGHPFSAKVILTSSEKEKISKQAAADAANSEKATVNTPILDGDDVSKLKALAEKIFSNKDSITELSDEQSVGITLENLADLAVEKARLESEYCQVPIEPNAKESNVTDSGSNETDSIMKVTDDSKVETGTETDKQESNKSQLDPIQRNNNNVEESIDVESKETDTVSKETDTSVVDDIVSFVDSNFKPADTNTESFTPIITPDETSTLNDDRDVVDKKQADITGPENNEDKIEKLDKPFDENEMDIDPEPPKIVEELPPIDEFADITGPVLSPGHPVFEDDEIYNPLDVEGFTVFSESETEEEEIRPTTPVLLRSITFDGCERTVTTRLSNRGAKLTSIGSCARVSKYMRSVEELFRDEEHSYNLSEIVHPNRKKRVTTLTVQRRPLNIIQTASESLNSVFEYLSIPDLLKASQVCKTWRRIASQQFLWSTVKLKDVHIIDWKMCTQTLDQNNTVLLDLRGVVQEKSQWHNFLACLYHLRKIQGVVFGEVPPWVITSVVNCLPELRCMEAEDIVNDNSSLVKMDPGVLARLQEMTILRIRAPQGMQVPKFNLYGGLRALGSLPNLTHLSLTSLRKLGNDDVIFLEKLSHLQVLEIGQCKEWTEQAYHRLGKLRALRRLRLEMGSQSADRGLANALIQMSRLQELTLLAYRVTSSMAASIRRLRHLWHLTIWPDMSTEGAMVVYNTLQAVRSLKRLQSFSWGIIYQDDTDTRYSRKQSKGKYSEAADVDEWWSEELRKTQRAKGIKIPMLKAFSELGANEQSKDDNVDTPSGSQSSVSGMEQGLIGVGHLRHKLQKLLPDSEIYVYQVPESLLNGVYGSSLR